MLITDKVKDVLLSETLGFIDISTCLTGWLVIDFGHWSGNYPPDFNLRFYLLLLWGSSILNACRTVRATGNPQIYSVYF